MASPAHCRENAGLRLDVCGTVACTFPAAGRYTMVLDGGMVGSVVDNDFQYAVALRTSGTGNAGLSVFAGNGVCHCGPSLRSGDRTINCPLPQGPATVILEADPVTAEYQLTHQAAT